MFCRNCGKEIGEGRFCSWCGTAYEIGKVAMPISHNDKENQSLNTETTEKEQGKASVLSYKTADEALSAFNKSCLYKKLRIAFIFPVMLSLLLSIGIWAISFFTLYDEEYSFITIALIALSLLFMWLTSALFIPVSIFELISLKELRAWITKNNVNCRAIVKNERAEPDKALILATYIIEHPEKEKKLNTSQILATIFYPLCFQFFGVWLAVLSFLSYIISIPLIESGLFTSAEEGYILLFPCAFIAVIIFIILILIFNIPKAIAGAGLKKKARNNFYQNHA